MNGCPLMHTEAALPEKAEATWLSLRETTGRARGRIFAYVRYLDALNAETEATTP
jgi:hypothetical protein